MSNNSRASGGAKVSRHHRADSASCEEAISLLLDFAKQSGRSPNKSGPDDATVRNMEGVSYVDRRPS
ncbi:MAG: hypothetical protein AVDCRST_MAG93-8421 [uncultured Chloroflexia bacterium]|uniref:Uncharacterized protein n=1 Tax=uncultured Chloroflexia bacterium TaxID=1672391 RepID=A0A6J4MY22_9CHLR|nr:MAG: hypothetical protein AVDCRST_MAG93-8421 [uncultured Chloroflexia bacterium]